ncbi:MAG: hypothetical protein LC808_23030 [Actinobacteria bacterium]|nr:hypothetical protein [Actinomycetota bacterium]
MPVVLVLAGTFRRALLCPSGQLREFRAYTAGRATYDLRRLRLKGLIERVPRTHNYRVTAHGRRIATFFTRLAARVVVPILTELDAAPRPPRHAPLPVVAAWRAYDAELRKLLRGFAKVA